MGMIWAPEDVLKEARKRKQQHPNKKNFDICVDIAIEKRRVTLDSDPLMRAFRAMSKGNTGGKKKPPEWGIGL